MAQFTNIARTLTAGLFAIVLSTTMVLGAVAPAQTGSTTQIVRAIA